MSEAVVVSPCVGICQIDARQRCCGCGRTLDEIAEWSSATPARQKMIVELAQQRLAAMPTPDSQPRDPA